MANYPTQLDEIDQWLVDNFGIMPGACSSTENLRHTTARTIAEALWPKCKDSLHIQETCKENGKTVTDCNELKEGETVTDCHQLEEEVTRYLRKKCSADDEPSVSEIARHFANWQEEQDHYACQQCEKDYGNVFYKGEQHARKMMEKENRKIIELAEDHAMLAGMVKKEEEMREKALELTVCLDDSGHPYIPEIVLFDFDKNQPTAKVGDTIGVYLFKNR